MNSNHGKRVSRAVVTTVVAALALWTTQVIARSSGVSGVSQSATGCSCHSSTPNQSGPVTVSISGPQYVAPGSTNSYTISATGGPAGTTGGVDLKATGGTLIAGTGTKILSTELVHSSNALRTWTFTWQAPAAEGSYSFYAVAMCSDGSSTSGDSWNWYGGVVSTPFPITVSSLVDVPQRDAGGLFLAPATPNPSRGLTRITFTLPEAGPARLEVFDLGGRSVARLVSGEIPAGVHTVTWDGTNARGDRLPGGCYFFTLRAEGRTLTRRVVLAR